MFFVLGSKSHEVLKYAIFEGIKLQAVQCRTNIYMRQKRLNWLAVQNKNQKVQETTKKIKRLDEKVIKET